MANIKFSQFTVGNTESDIDFVVGYKGANNIQISPTNLLAASLSGYLPLTGGTMTGNIVFNDNVKAKFGNSGDMELYHDGGHSYIKQGGAGDLYIQQFRDNGDIVFQSDDGSGGMATYFYLDGQNTRTEFFKDVKFPDNVKANFGTALDLEIYHNGTASFINNETGDLNIANYANDKDIIFYNDNGSGGVAEYFKLDGSLADGTNVFTKFVDNSWITMGNGGDLLIGHQTTSSKIENYTGPLYIVNKADDQDIIFQSDNGSGGTETYFYLDGSAGKNISNKNFRIIDTKILSLGSSDDLKIYHNATDSIILNETGDLYIANGTDDKDIIFQSDDGSGGLATYLTLDGSQGFTTAQKTIRFDDGAAAQFGGAADLRINHNGTDSFITNHVGDLKIIQNTDNGDISFQSDDGSGGVTEYFSLDGGNVRLNAKVDLRIYDAKKLQLGNSGDLQIYHNNSNDRGYIYNTTGDLYIENDATDGDIKFFSDDGSGGTDEYFRVDGSSEKIIYSKNQWLYDNIRAVFGSSDDLQIYHNGTNSLVENSNGDFYISNKQDDGDIIFFCDDGSGGTTEYFKLDGTNVRTLVSKQINLIDGVPLQFGNSQDLRIYHNGNNSYIQDAGTGSLKILAQDFDLTNAAESALMIRAIDGAQVELYYGGSKKFETTSAGVKISGVSEYADNTAAIAGGLTTGDVYRTGDLLKIVH